MGAWACTCTRLHPTGARSQSSPDFGPIAKGPGLAWPDFALFAGVVVSADSVPEWQVARTVCTGYAFARSLNSDYEEGVAEGGSENRHRGVAGALVLLNTHY